MNESDTRLKKIDPKLKESGWGVEKGSSITTEYCISKGKISQSVKPKPRKADYILIYNNVKIAVIEAKSDEKDVSDGVAQAKEYAHALKIRYTYSCNGDKIYQIDLKNNQEIFVNHFPTPEELWQMTFEKKNEWRDTFAKQSSYIDGAKTPRYYQEIAINKVLSSIAEGKDRILLTLATGTGKTFIAFQIVWKLFQTRWNVRKTNTRPRVLFLADRNTLANQAYESFEPFKDARIRIKPSEIRKNDRVPTNGSVFFTIFQTFMSGDGEQGYFGEYPKDFFDLIIIDECHRGGARDESQWRGILEYFSSAVQLGLTATPRRDCNADTYKYFGEPVYEYSLKQGIMDGFLTPFRHIAMSSTIDEYTYDEDDTIISGEIEQDRVYNEDDFYHGRIYIKKRDEERVNELLQHLKPYEKTLIFCATQNHAGQIRDMINAKTQLHRNYAVRVTANDGDLGEQALKEFKDNEKNIPTILTTSQKLSTGVDALNVRNIVLFRPVKSMIEFKQIVGRGTRLFDGKYFFTIYDFVRAYEKYKDPTWDGEPVCTRCNNNPCTCKAPTSSNESDNPRPIAPREIDPGSEVVVKREKLVIKLSEANSREISFTGNTMFWGADGNPIAAEEFLKEMFGRMPDFFSNKEDLQT